MVHGRKNFLEDFHFDRELVEFLDYYSTKEFVSREVELVINGDFFDFLAVPFVEYFDDEFWSEKAAIEKLKLMLKGHSEVMEAFAKFLCLKKKSITYIIGNHDAELIFPRVQQFFIESLPKEVQGSFAFYNTSDEYQPTPGVIIKHGHQYENAHDFDPQTAIIHSSKGEAYFIPPWGSFYVTRVINKFKEERSYINSVQPINSFLIYGFLFDPLFTLRFLLANLSYFFMVRFMALFQMHSLRSLWKAVKKDLVLFKGLEREARKFFHKRPEVEVLIVGHTHQPQYQNFATGGTFINTGTWTKMINLELPKLTQGYQLTYAEVNVPQELGQSLEARLNIWRGPRDRPYKEFY